MRYPVFYEGNKIWRNQYFTLLINVKNPVWFRQTFVAISENLNFNADAN
jgi:hypothetical protein